MSREYTRAFFISKKYMEMVMENRLIEGMEEDVAKKYVELYEHITRITCEIDALGKAIETISLYGNSDTFYLGYLGSIIEEKSDEICTLIDSFVLYPTIYFELKERKEGRK